MNKNSLNTKLLFGASVTAFLAGCGGGGGGPGSSIRADAYTRVPYATPRLIGDIDPLEKNTPMVGIIDMFAADITGDGGQDVIFAGRMAQQADGGTDWYVSRENWSNSRLSMFSWQNGNLVDKTAQWFPNNSNVILGTEPSVKFADLDNTGRLDMFVSPSTDSPYYGPASVFFNDGDKFTRVDVPLNNVWGHDGALADFNNDGYTDFIVVSTNSNTTVGLNTKNRGFVTYIQDPNIVTVLSDGAGVAAADFLNNGTNTVMVANVGRDADTVLYTVAFNDQFVEFTQVSTLPKPRFNLPKYAQYNFGDPQRFTSPSHSVRVSAHDFNDNNLIDAIVFTMPTSDSPENARFSEIQFLDNRGNGNFIDVTDSILVGYDNRTIITYNPKFVDFNNDGLTDILVSGQDWNSKSTSHQFLMKTADGKFVSAYQNILTDFVSQTNAMQKARASGTIDGGQFVNLIRDPDGKIYLMTAVAYNRDGDGDYRQAVYLSELSNTGNIVTPQMSIDMLKSAWPYLTDGTANEVLARSGKTYLSGTIIDHEAAFRPVGQLGLAMEGRTGPVRPLSGYIAGIKLSPALSKIAVVDELKRDFQVDLSGTTVNRGNLWSQTRNVTTDFTSAEKSHAMNLVGGPQYNFSDFQAAADNVSQVFSVGTPAFRINDHAKFHVQFTSLNFSPWLSMNGIWGKVNSTFMTEFVTSFERDNWVLNTGAIWSKTNIDPGLVTSVDDIWSLWAEAGFRDHESGWGAFVGLKPWAISGDVNLRLPTGVNSDGVMQYTNQSVGIQNSLDTYVRLAYSFDFTKDTRVSLGGILFSDGRHGVTANMQFRF